MRAEACDSHVLEPECSMRFSVSISATSGVCGRESFLRPRKQRTPIRQQAIIEPTTAIAARTPMTTPAMSPCRLCLLR